MSLEQKRVQRNAYQISTGAQCGQLTYSMRREKEKRKQYGKKRTMALSRSSCTCLKAKTCAFTMDETQWFMVWSTNAMADRM